MSNNSNHSHKVLFAIVPLPAVPELKPVHAGVMLGTIAQIRMAIAAMIAKRAMAARILCSMIP
jgi:hypothetical protein